MAMTDPIADMLTRIRNANTAGHAKVEIPASKMKKSIAEILKNEGFIKDFSVAQDNAQGTITVELKYGPNKEKTIYGIKKISKPGLRVYAKADQGYLDLKEKIDELASYKEGLEKAIATIKETHWVHKTKIDYEKLYAVDK